jgi:putative endonuclease
MSWLVYILTCSDDTLYTGVCTDLQRRLNEHNGEGSKGAKYTRARRPVTVFYQESCADRASACRREAAIKKLSRQQKLALINNVTA